jgi:hypothetical protein
LIPHADGNLDPVLAQTCKPSTLDLRKWIFHGRDDASNAGGNDAIGTWTRSTMVRAWLERAVQRRAARRLTCLVECMDFGVRLTCPLVGALTDDDALVTDDARTDDRIRGRTTESASRGFQRTVHPACVAVRRSYHFS